MLDSRSPLSTSMVRSVWAVVVLAVLSGCGEPEVAWRSPIEFDTARVSVVGDGDTSRLLVEVARTDEQRGFGLMIRPELDPASGMLFVYDSVQSDSSGFWMWRTRVPLDIAYIDSAGRIVSIRQMAPCESPYARDCPQYGPGAPYQSALEVNQGWFQERGFGAGDRVVVDSMAPPLPGASSPSAEGGAPVGDTAAGDTPIGDTAGAEDGAGTDDDGR